MDSMNEMKKLQSIYSVRGFSLNLCFTDMDTIIETIYNTDVHSNNDPSTEFVVSVYCHGFYNNATSVWIYIASLTKLQIK